MELRLRPEIQRLDGTATLDFAASATLTALRLTPQADVLTVESAGRPLPFTFRGGRLIIDQGAGARIGQLTIRYSARFDDPLPRDTVGSEDPSFGVRATILPEGAFLAAGVPWFPQAQGQRGRHRVTISAPAGLLAVTAGRFVGSNTAAGLTVSTWQNDLPLDGLALAAGRFQIARDELDGIQLLTFLSPDNAALAPGYLAAMRRHLIFYRDLLGPYPFSKFAVVENFLPTGYGLPSWTLLGKSVVRLPFLLDTSLPHEIVHSWWGNAVEVDYQHGNWAEGLTTYLADYLLKERDDPLEAFAYRRKLLRDYAALVTPAIDFPLQQFIGREAKYQQAIGYGKGAMVFHMLRREVGDEAFWQALHRMATEGNGRVFGWGDIERSFAAAAGRDLRWFFAQWVERRGAPQLALTEVRTSRSAQGWRVTGVVRQQGDSYRLELPVRLTTVDGDLVEQTVRLSGPRTPFVLTTTDRPTNLEADPGSDLFRRLQPEELPATVNDLLTPQQPLVIVAQGEDDLLKAAENLLKGLHWEEAQIVAEAAVEPDTLQGRDVLLLGWPSRKELRPRLPSELEVRSGSPPTWKLSKDEAKSDTLFAVLARRQNDHGARAILLATAAEPARAVAARISHYGRYSLLLFNGGRNVAKSTWEPVGAPLQMVFPKE